MATDEWSREQELVFEYALVIFDENTVDRWEKIAAEVPGKTVEEIKRHYEVLVDDVNNIEAGNVSLPDYNSFPESEGGGPEKKVAKPKIQRRKRISWTKDEHRLFLEGLEKIGKNDWKGISEKYVLTKTPKQVGVHGYNYFRYLKKERMRSINDVTNVKNGDFSAIQGPNTGQACNSAAGSTGQSVELAHAGVHAGINDAALPVGIRTFDTPWVLDAGIHATPRIGRPFESAIRTRVNLHALGSRMNLGPMTSLAVRNHNRTALK